MERDFHFTSVCPGRDTSLAFQNGDPAAIFRAPGSLGAGGVWPAGSLLHWLVLEVFVGEIVLTVVWSHVLADRGQPASALQLP